MAITGGPTVTLKFKGDTDDLTRAIAGIQTAVSGLSMMGVGLAGTVGVLGALGAAASAAVLAVAAVPFAFAGIGIAAAAQSEQVKGAFTAMKDHVWTNLQSMTGSIQAELIKSAGMITATYDALAPRIGAIFALVAPQISQMTGALLNFVTNAMPGFETAIRNSQPLVDAFARGLGMLGTGIGDFFARLSEGTPGAVAGLDALFKLTQDLLGYLGQLVGQLANSLGPAFADLEPSIMQVVRALGDGLLTISQTLAPYLGTLGHTIADLVTAAIAALTPVVQALLPFLAEFGNMVGQILLPILNDLAPVLASVARELADGLRPLIPVITDAFRQMEPTMRAIAEQAGPLLAEIIRTLAPLIVTLVQAALDLTKALLPVIPPLLEMANNAMPLVNGVIVDVLIPAIKWLVTEFVGLIDYGVKIAEAFATLSARWRTYWDEIKAAFADADAKIRAGIDGFVSLGETARRHWDAMYQAIKGKIEEIVAWAAAFPQRILDAIAAFVDRFAQAGANLMQSFADGINSKADAAKDAAGNVVGGTEALFPQSPPPEGPFAGTGWTLYRGQSLIQGFIDGISSMWDRAHSAVTSGLGNLRSVIEQVMPGAGADLAALARGATFGWNAGTGTAAAAVPGLGSIELKVAPGADSALSSMLMNLVRTGQLQLARA